MRRVPSIVWRAPWFALRAVGAVAAVVLIAASAGLIQAGRLVAAPFVHFVRGRRIIPISGRTEPSWPAPGPPPRCG